MENMNDWRWYGESGGVVDQCFNRPRGSSRRTRKKEVMKEKQEVIQDLEDAEPVLEKKARSSRSKSSSRRRPPPGQEDEEMEEKTLR